MDSHDTAHVTHQVSTAVRSRKMLLHVLTPHTHDRVPVVTVQLSALTAERKTIPRAFAKELWEEFAFDGMDGIKTEPPCEGG